MIDTISNLSYCGNNFQFVPPMPADDLEVKLAADVVPEVLVPTQKERNVLRAEILSEMRNLAQGLFRINNPRLIELEKSIDVSKRVSNPMEAYFYGARPASFKPGVADMSLFKQFLDDSTIDYVYRELKTSVKRVSLKQIALNVLNNSYYSRYS